MKVGVSTYHKGSGLSNFGPSGGGLIRGGGVAYLKFFDKQRQDYTMSILNCYAALVTTMNYCAR